MEISCNISRIAALLAIVGFVCGCVPVTELAYDAPPPFAAHLVPGHRLLFIGPARIKSGETAAQLAADNGVALTADYMMVVPLPSTPPHVWHPEPMFAFRKPGTDNQYTLQVRVSNADHTNELHTLTLTIVSRRPWDIEIRSADGEPDHGGAVHYR